MPAESPPVNDIPRFPIEVKNYPVNTELLTISSVDSEIDSNFAQSMVIIL
jgi:hypothetical protein